LLDDYYQRGFGPAAADVPAFHDTMETAFAQLVAIDSVRNLAKHFMTMRKEVYTDALFEEAGGHLQRAAERSASVSGKFTPRVAFLRAGLDFTRHLLEAVNAGSRYALSKNKDTEARDAARAHWRAIQQIDADHPNAFYLRLISPEGSGLYLPLGEE